MLAVSYIQIVSWINEWGIWKLWHSLFKTVVLKLYFRRPNLDKVLSLQVFAPNRSEDFFEIKFFGMSCLLFSAQREVKTFSDQVLHLFEIFGSSPRKRLF